MVESYEWLVGGLPTVPVAAWVILGGVIAVGSMFLVLVRRKGARRVYAAIINATLHYRWSTVAVACVVLGFGYHLYTKVGKRPFRWQPARQVAFNVEVPRSYSLEHGLALYEQVEKTLLPVKDELNIDAISTRFSVTGTKKIVLYLVPIEKGSLSVDQVKRKVKAHCRSAS